MEIYLEILFIAMGLSMDIFAVAVCQGLAMIRINRGQVAVIGLTFGGFQSLLFFLGWLLGSRFEHYVVRMNHWIAFGLLTVIGGEMICDAWKKEECPDMSIVSRTKDILGLLGLALATSVDAFAVGVTSALLTYPVKAASVIMGVTALTISVSGVFVGNYFGSCYKNKAEFCGGILLIILGIRIFLSHFGLE